MVMPDDSFVAHTGRSNRRQASVDQLAGGTLIRNRSLRMMGMATLSAVGLAGVLVLGTASIAAANQTTTLSVSPYAVSGAGCTGGCNVTVTWAHAHHTNAGSLVIVECNYNVYTGDETACNEDPDNLDQPGGPWIPSEQTSNGSAVISFQTGAVGDGTCDGGQVCAVVLANINTEAPIAGPTPLAVTP